MSLCVSNSNMGHAQSCKIGSECELCCAGQLRKHSSRESSVINLGNIDSSEVRALQADVWHGDGLSGVELDQ